MAPLTIHPAVTSRRSDPYWRCPEGCNHALYAGVLISELLDNQPATPLERFMMQLWVSSLPSEPDSNSQLRNEPD